MINLKEIIKKYLNYILIVIIVLLIIIIGFLYSNSVTNKVEKEEIKEDIKEVEKDNGIKRVYVDIKGEVINPDVYELNEDERIIDVIKKAGGLTEKANINYLNLSKKVKDEMVIIIYSDDEIKEYEKNLKESSKPKEIIKYEIIEKEIPCPNISNEACINKKEESSDINNEKIIDNEDKTTLINLNTASKEELLTLTGIGESKAEQIIDYRNNNKFKTIEDIKNIKGIGDSLFEKIKDSITV